MTIKALHLKFLFYVSLFVFSLFFNACSSNSPLHPVLPSVYQTGGDTHTVTMEAGSDLTDLKHIRRQAYKKAEIYCQTIQKSFKLVNEDATYPPYTYGSSPQIILIFQCY